MSHVMSLATMSSVSELVRNTLDARADAENLLSEGIEIWNKLSKDLNSLLNQVDNLTRRAKLAPS